jgi:hypothetical protein
MTTKLITTSRAQSGLTNERAGIPGKAVHAAGLLEDLADAGHLLLREAEGGEGVGGAGRPHFAQREGGEVGEALPHPRECYEKTETVINRLLANLPYSTIALEHST